MGSWRWLGAAWLGGAATGRNCADGHPTMHSFIPATIRRYRDPRLSSIERIADAIELAVLRVPEHMAPDIRRYIASQGRVFTTTQSTKETAQHVLRQRVDLESLHAHEQ